MSWVRGTLASGGSSSAESDLFSSSLISLNTAPICDSGALRPTAEKGPLPFVGDEEHSLRSLLHIARTENRSGAPSHFGNVSFTVIGSHPGAPHLVNSP
jgi:hypothetical protein